MFGFAPKSDCYLFYSTSLMDDLANIRGTAFAEVERLEANRLLNTAPDDLICYLVNKASVEPISLRKDEWYAEFQEVQIDVRHDPLRDIFDVNRPVLIPGEQIEVHVPFNGPAQFFFARSHQSTLSPPRARVVGQELILEFQYPSHSPREIRPEIDQLLREIEQHLGWQIEQIDAHNASLRWLAEQTVHERRERLLAKLKRTAALGIPIRQKGDAPKTYAVPSVRRKANPSLPLATSASYEPEPTWAMEQYEHALKIMQDMSVVMERSPAAFKTMDEEAIRQNFLLQLNGQFEGKATGETFNMGGKTDILLREGERNVFIAECKFWKGPKGFSEAIDQLLKYTTWRDSKTAILVFNRGTEPSRVLAGVDTAATEHVNFKRKMEYAHESGFRYVFHQVDDANRELIITVLVFHVPT